MGNLNSNMNTDDIVKKYNLVDYLTWLNILKDTHLKSDNKELFYDWLHDNNYRDDNKLQILNTYSFYSDKFDIIYENVKHNKADLNWQVYYIRNQKNREIKEFYGYKFL